MPTPYEKVYERFLPKFRDYDIPVMPEDMVMERLHDYLVSATSRFHDCRNDLDDRDDLLMRFNCELSGREIEILANYMVFEYVDSTYVRTPTLLKASLSSSDFNAYSPANMLDKLNNLQERSRIDNETLLMWYAWDDAKENGVSWSKGYKKNKMGLGMPPM